MALTSDYLGMDVFTRDDEKLGQVKDSLQDVDFPSTQYLLIDRSLAKDIVLPASIVDHVGDRLVVPYDKDFIDHAPEVGLSGRTLSSDDRALLENYYVRRAA